MKKFLLLALLPLFSLPAQAEPMPNDPCTPAQNGHFLRSGGPEEAGSGALLTCNGSQWRAILSYDATGKMSVGSLPTSGNHIASKSYVDAAVAAIASGAGGGSNGLTGNVCYYATGSACGMGFSQMPGTYNNGVAHIICCAGAGSGSDITPTAFDFPDADVDYATPHTWSPLQITGFTSAPVTLNAPPLANAQYRICADSSCSNVLKNWKSTPDIINNDEYLQIRTVNGLIGAGNITVAVGDMSDTATITRGWLAFVTNSSTLGNIGGIAGADTVCQNGANAAGATGTYKAWISMGSNTNSPSVRFTNAGTTRPFYKRDNTKLVDNWADLIDGSLDSALNISETGVTRNINVWTNVATNGTTAQASNRSCDNLWNENSSGYNGFTGASNLSTSGWTHTGVVQSCNNAYALYCFQTAE